MTCWDEGKGDCAVGKVNVLVIGRREEGLLGLRFFHPPWTALISAMKRADEEIYYYNAEISA
jgi:hypothetical protein